MGRAKARFPDYSAAPPQLNLADWSRLERAYGHQLPKSLRQQILEETEILKFAAICSDDHRITDVEKRIKRIQSRAKALHAAFRAGRPSPAQLYGDGLIDAYFQTEFSVDPTKEHDSVVSYLTKLMDTLDAACTSASASLGRVEKNNAPNRYVWGLWIDALTRILKASDFPTGARKDSDKKKGNRPPAFVALVHELQKSLPPEYRPPFHSYDALAQAISRARR